jgi:uncharacterized OB-fold protein
VTTAEPRDHSGARPVMTERPVPIITEMTEPFWTGGASGRLLIAHCQACGHWMHPPLPVCRQCRGRDVRPEAVSGRGVVWSSTVNRYRWAAGIVPPYVLAEIELVEQPGLRLLSAIVGRDEVAIGTEVTVRFERTGAAWAPVFAP